MMKNLPQYKMPSAHAAAAVLLAGALGAQALPVMAQESGPAPRLAMTKPAAGASDNLQTPPVEVFRSAPTLPTNNVVPSENAKISAPESTAGAGQGSVSALDAVTRDEVPNVLEPNLHPWPLNYVEPPPLNALFFTLPTEREVRVMLPGNASDEIGRVRFAVNRYITDSIGNAAQARSRQLDAFQTWHTNYRKQKSDVPKEPWAEYQFNQAALAVVKSFKDRVQAQSAPELARMVKDVNSAVSQISPVMEATGGYELKLQWYNILVQLKEGVALYQARVADADKPLLDAITAFEDANPRVPRPAGPVPRKDSISEIGAPLGMAAVTDGPTAQREPAKPVPMEAPPSQTGGIIVMVGIAAAAFGMFMKLRKRVAGKAGQKKD